MPRPFLIFSQSDYLNQIVAINSHTQWQKVQIQISWLLQKPTDLDLHFLPDTAGQGLNNIFSCDSYVIIIKGHLGVGIALN